MCGGSPEYRKLTEAVEGNLRLTSEQRLFAQLYLSTVLAIEQTTPKALNLNPYKLQPLNCARLLHRARNAN